MFVYYYRYGFLFFFAITFPPHVLTMVNMVLGFLVSSNLAVITYCIDINLPKLILVNNVALPDTYNYYYYY
jgi:hypothetical protein